MRTNLPDTLSGLTRTPEGYEGVLRAPQGDVKISINFDGCPEESVLRLATQIVAHLKSIDERCKTLAAEEFLVAYNGNWRMGQVLQPDGSTKSFEHPELERSEFVERLLLSSVGVTGDQTSDIWYECGDLFWGHDLFVTAFDGISFKDTHVQMAG